MKRLKIYKVDKSGCPDILPCKSTVGGGVYGVTNIIGENRISDPNFNTGQDFSFDQCSWES